MSQKKHVFNIIAQTALFIAVSIIIGSCGGVRRQFLRKVDQPYLQDAKKAPTQYSIEEYKIQPRDLLAVNLNSPDENTNIYFNRETGGMRINQPNPIALYTAGYLVDDDGNVNLPLIGLTQVSGKTTGQIEQQVSEKVAKYLKEFSVSVKLTNFRVTLLGEVSRPGTYYFYESKVTVLQALSQAGDFQEYADRKKVRLIRDINGEVSTYELDLTNQEILSSEQFLLMPNDVIYVEPLKSKVFNTNSRVLALVLSSVTAALTLFRIIQTSN